MKSAKIALILLILVLVSACQSTAENEPTATQFTLSPTATLRPSSTPTKIPTATPTNTISPSPTPTPLLITDNLVRLDEEGAALQSAGPWLVFNTNKGTIIVDQSGDEVGILPLPEGVVGASSTASPTGKLFATFYEHQYENPNGILEIRQLPDNQVLLNMNLGAAILPWEESFYNPVELGYRTYDFLYSMGRMAWSHNGKYLGFVGSPLNQSTDLYTYAVETGLVTQISSTWPAAVDFYWSPTDEYIFHADADELFAEANGSGYRGWEFYTSTPDGIQSQQIFRSPIEERSFETVLGWYTDTKAIVSRTIDWCGSYDLRIIDIVSGKISSFGPELVQSIAYDPVHKTFLYSVISPEDTTLEECKPEEKTGYYLFSIPNQQTIKVDFLELPPVNTYISFNENISKFFLYEYYGKSAVIDSSGTVEIFEAHPFFSPSGEWVATIEEGYRENITVINLKTSQEIIIEYSDDVLVPVWHPESNTLYYLLKPQNTQKYNLYKATAPDFIPELIIKDAGTDIYLYAPLVWVNP